MRRWILLLILVALATVIVGPMRGSAADTETRDTQELWKKVDEADRQGLPKTAIKYLEEIQRLAREGAKYGEALRALVRLIVLESIIKGNKPEDKVNRLRSEIPTAPQEMKVMMNVVLAQWYWHYYQRNRWRFLKRTRTTGLDEEDFTTWDLPKIFNEISSLYSEVLKQESLLKKIEVGAYDDFLDRGSLPESLRPTLFDFAAFEAISFFTSGDQVGASPQDAFELRGDGPAFAGAEEFIGHSFKTGDPESPAYKAVVLFQKVIRFHREKDNRDAFLDADIHRLRYVRNTAAGEDLGKTYITRLREIIREYPESPLTSLARFYWAGELKKEGRLSEAHALAARGLADFPSSRGGVNCKALMAEIERKQFALKTELVVRPDQRGSMVVSYQNLTTLHFRVYAENLDGILSGKRGTGWSNLNRDALGRLLKQQALETWSQPLPATPDYKTRQVRIDLPELPRGMYRLVASARSDFNMEGNQVASSLVSVSRLAIVARSGNGRLTGHILENRSGDPLAEAAISLFRFDYNRKRYDLVQKLSTDDSGRFEFTSHQAYRGHNLMLVAQAPGMGRLIQQRVPRSYQRNEVPYTTTHFFTDRALYRPGQMIHFKGICLRVDRGKNDYAPIPSRRVTVRLLDANNQEVEKLTLTSNDFGSFSGTFTAPTDRLLGRMTLKADSPRGGTSFRVEEYKRPKFRVTVDTPQGEFRLNDTVTVTGEALAFTGAAVDGARVSYRVVREVRFPRWWYEWFGNPQSGRQEITHGSVRTDERGRFAVSFTAKADPKVAKSSQPVFTFTVHSDVTDSAGETRSASTAVRLGYTALEAQVQAADWQVAGKPVLFTVTTRNLNGSPLAASGRLEVYRLGGPKRPVRTDLIGEYPLLKQTKAGDGPGSRYTTHTPDWKRWPVSKRIVGKAFETGGDPGSSSTLSFRLREGAYRVKLTTSDRFGTPVESFAHVMVLDAARERFRIPIPFLSVSESTSVEVGGTFNCLWATGYDRGPLLVEVYQNHRLLNKYWTPAGQTQGRVTVPVTSGLRGGFTVVTTLVKENRLYRKMTRVYVPWTDKRLQIGWETFRSKLEPGQKETWRLKISGPGADRVAAEMAATLYDASLDSYYAHHFNSFSSLFRRDNTYFQVQFTNLGIHFTSHVNNLNPHTPYFSATYTHFPEEVKHDLFGYGYGGRYRKLEKGIALPRAAVGGTEEAEPMEFKQLDAAAVPGKKRNGGDKDQAPQAEAAAPPDLDQVKARRNLNETAFFFPHLETDAEGRVTMEFTMPEALTEWRFIGFAHTRTLQFGHIEGRTVTQKELMVQPNPPRFLREGDRLAFSVKVTNQSDVAASGSLRLTFFDPRTNRSLDRELSLMGSVRQFTIPAGLSRSYMFDISVPDGLDILSYRAVGSSGSHSDGEEGALPVLSRRILVRESLPLWISGAGKKDFRFEKLASSGSSETLKHQALVVQMASNPAWYAVQALPFLMEFPYECAEQVFNRLYANALARKIANSDPKIRRIFDLWKGTDALDSNLEKNDHLKSVLLKESPWVLQAQRETQAKRRVGLLFDDSRMNRELKRAYRKLAAMQLSDGSWPWFPGGPGNSYITLYILTGFGRMAHLGVDDIPQDAASKAISYLDNWISSVYIEILRRNTANLNHLTTTIALYLYGRSFYLETRPVAAGNRKAVDYFLGQARKYWLKLAHRQSQGHLALALKRFGDADTPNKILRSIMERSQFDEELGRYWGELEFSWWWYRAPIETQAVMIEAFDEVMGDSRTVEECKIWLLKQKQTQDWKTTKATADAVYALILRGSDLLASDALVEVRLAGEAVKPEKVEAGTGFYEKRYSPDEIEPAMGEISLLKTDGGIAWGGVHWQYMEDIGKITPHTQNPLKLEKRLFVRRFTKKGPEIRPVTGRLKVGDLVTVRVILRTDRDMEYVHLKDHRGSGTEPVNVLSRYKYQDGLVYYESTRDTATDFFIDYLPKGTYVFEYGVRVVHAGTYQSGMAHIECMYAPEFNSHSQSFEMRVEGQ